jgi:two-component system sensor histidine kinase UhpB
LYKAAHEGVSNAMRHSGGHLIQIRLSATEQAVHLMIEDDGHGIPRWDPVLQSSDTTLATAMGLRGMQHRMQGIGGQCTIHSDTSGTRIEFTLPCHAMPSQGPGT